MAYSASYHRGSIVSYKGALYKSTLNDNVWSPDQYGWELYEAVEPPRIIYCSCFAQFYEIPKSELSSKHLYYIADVDRLLRYKSETDSVQWVDVRGAGTASLKGSELW